MQLNEMLTDGWLNAVVNSMEEGIVITNEFFEIKSINSTAEKLLGWELEDIVNKKADVLLKIYLPSNSSPIDIRSYSKLDGKEVIPSFLLNKKSEKIFIGFKIKPVFIGDETKGYILYFRNNQDHTEAVEIRESEKKYKGLFENAIEGIFILDNDGNIIDANPAACRIYYIEKYELLKLQVSDVFPHKSEQEAWAIWRGFLKEGFLDGFYKFKLKNGEARYIDFKVRANFIQGLHLAIFSDVTEKTLTAKALRNSEANLRAIFNNTNQQFILLDTESRIVTFNESAKESTFQNMGMEMREGTSIFDYGKPGDKELMGPIYEKVKKGETVFFETNPSHTNKPDHWLEVVFIPVFNDVKKLKGILLSITDITTRKKAELHLSESEARFRSLVQNSSDLITILDLNNKIKYTSASIEKILGYKEEDLEGKDILNFIHEDERQIVRRIFSKIGSGEKFNPVLEYRFLHKQGFYLYLETTCNNLIDNEHIRGIVLNTRDISERKYQEENLLLLERAIDSSSNGIIISDPNQEDNPIIYANKAFEQITGYNYLDIIGKNCRYLQMNDRMQPEIEKIRVAFSNQKEVSVILRNYKKDGKLFWNQLSISPVFNRNGQLSNYIGVINDITERKIAEDALLEISQGISASVESDLYGSIVKHIGLRLQKEFVSVGEFGGDKVKTRGLWMDGAIRENIEYELEGTPCQQILIHQTCIEFENVSEKFPLDTRLTKEKIYSYMGVPLRDSEGKAIGVLAIMSRGKIPNKSLAESILNIFSVRVSAELERDYYITALKTSEKKFKDLAKNSPDLIYIIDLDIKRVIYFNRSEVLGYRDHELSLSEAWMQIVHPEDVEKVKSHWNNFLSSPDNFTRSIEYRILTKQGIYEWVTNRHIVIERSVEGKPKLVLLNITVITERKKAEEGLRESEARLMALVENTNDIMWSVDSGLTFTTMNSAFKNLFKLHFDKNIEVGEPLRAALPDSLREEWMDLHERTLAGERFSVEFIIPGKTKDLSYEVSYNPIYSDKGNISGVSVFARDITQRKSVENDIIRTNFELDSFVYRASHDLRAPLRSVLGLVNLAKTELDQKERGTYLHLVEKSINKLDTFISDLTNFSRNSRLEVTITKINFRAIIDECLENLKYMDNAERIKTIIQIDSPHSFYSDTTRINIILQNIISNSIKYQNLRMDEPFVKIGIITFKDRAEISIADNGKGIKDEYLEKIFNMFFRASQESYGSGLGLYITKQVVEKLNGSISVTSKLGAGTAFKVILPNLEK